MTWDCRKKKHVEMPDEMARFFDDIVEVYRKHGLAISHEDYHGAFIIEAFNENDVKWLKEAHKNYTKKGIRTAKNNIKQGCTNDVKCEDCGFYLPETGSLVDQCALYGIPVPKCFSCGNAFKKVVEK